MDRYAHIFSLIVTSRQAMAAAPFVDKATRGVVETKNSNIRRFLVWGDFTG